MAAEAGVYKAAVSYHFGGKAGLMASLVTAYFDEIDERIVAAVRTRPPGRERVRFIVENWLDFVSPSNDLVFFDVLGYVLRKKELRDQLQDFYQRWTDLILRSAAGGLGHRRELVPRAGCCCCACSSTG